MLRANVSKFLLQLGLYPHAIADLVKRFVQQPSALFAYQLIC